jgi:hypothetical protein
VYINCAFCCHIYLLPARQDAHEGLESFAHFGLMIFSTAVKHRKEIEQAAEEENDDDCSVGSLTPAMGGMDDKHSNRLLLRAFSITDSDANYDDILHRLNKKIHSLFLDWEQRRENTKERNKFEKRKVNKDKDKISNDEIASNSATARKGVPVLVTIVKDSCYKQRNPSLNNSSKTPSSPKNDLGRSRIARSNSQPELLSITDMSSSYDSKVDKSDIHSSSLYLPYPSQLRALAPLSSDRLVAYMASRAKTRVSRKSDRVVIIERMKAAEKTFHTRRLTCEQMTTLLECIEGTDEKQHAALLFITKLTDVVEVMETSSDLFATLGLNFDCVKRVNMVGNILAAEARAENHLSAIHDLYTKSFNVGQKAKEVLNKSSLNVNEDADYLRLQSIQKLKDAPLVSPKLQSGMRNKIKDFRSDLTLVRQAVADIHSFLNAGYSLHLTRVKSEQDCIVKLTSELKLIVTQSESVCRMRGTLSSGRPEYLVFHRLKVL